MSDQNQPGEIGALEARASLDAPTAGQKVYDQAIFVSGWLHTPISASGSCRVCAYLDDYCVAETRTLFHRPDVSAKYNLEPELRSGFRMLGSIQPPATEPREATLRIILDREEESPLTLVVQPLRLVPSLLNERPYGQVLHPQNEVLLNRENIYGSGPPLHNHSVEAANLILGHLPKRTSVVDIGCGAGAYGPALIAAGHEWLGLESSPQCWEILQQRDLPFRRVDLNSPMLPGATGEWDCGICIEVLEHVKEPDAFVSEIARVTQGRVLFSVPNMEVLPYLHGWGVVPWHLLEADHKNFFTRASLRALLERHFHRVEVSFFCEHPLRTREDIPIYVHLFAVAEK